MRIAIIGVGAGLLLAAAVTAISVRTFRKAASEAEGLVVHLNAGGSHPQIEFTAASGEKVSVPQAGFIWGLHTGDKVHVLYDQARPAASARLDAVGNLWFLPLLLSFIGAAFVVTGLSLASGARGSSTPPAHQSRHGG